MRRPFRLILVTGLIFLTFSSLIIPPINAASDSDLAGNLNWVPAIGSLVEIGYILSESAGDGQTLYTLESTFNITSPVQLNGLVDNWIIGGRNFSIQIYARIATDFCLFQHDLNWSYFGIPGYEFEDSFSFSLPQSYDSIKLDYAMFTFLKENTTEYDMWSYGSGEISVIDEKNTFYPRSFAELSGEIQFHMEDEMLFPLEYIISGNRRETPQVEMGITLGQFSYEQPVFGYIEGIPHYPVPLFLFGCTIYNITYERSEGWINHYSKEYKSITSMIDSISEEEMNTGLSKTLPGDCDYQEMDSIKLLLHMNLYLFNWDLDFTFEKRPSILAHFFRTYWVILLAVGFVSITVTVTIIKKKRF